MTISKRSTPLLLAAILAVCLSASLAADPGYPDVTVDENGNGSLNFAGTVFPLVGTLQPDPGPGGLSSVLTYNLLGPPSLVAGDVLLLDGPFFLDVIRFNPAGTGGPGYPASLLFYSDNVDGFDSLGDTPSPPHALYPNVVVVSEVGTEGANGAFYTPTPGEPGYVAGFAVSYHFISDVPEPGSILLMASGLAVMFFAFRRRGARQRV